jgi:hypothetical protein
MTDKTVLDAILRVWICLTGWRPWGGHVGERERDALPRAPGVPARTALFRLAVTAMSMFTNYLCLQVMYRRVAPMSAVPCTHADIIQQHSA